MNHSEISIGEFRKIVGMERASNPEKQEIYNFTLVVEGKTTHLVITVQKRDSTSLVISIENRVYVIRQLKRSAASVDFLTNGNLIRAILSSAPKAGTTAPETQKSDVALVNEIVSSNFPAKVVSIKASKGMKLVEGETLLIMEAMKMEAQIKVPKDCLVIDLFVSEGDMVQKGEKLAQLKFD